MGAPRLRALHARRHSRDRRRLGSRDPGGDATRRLPRRRVLRALALEHRAAARARGRSASATWTAGSSVCAGEALPRREDPEAARQAVEATGQARRCLGPTAPASRSATGASPPDAPGGPHALPRYVRGVAGVVEMVRGVDVFPDIGPYEGPEPVYAVAFTSSDLFGRRTRASGRCCSTSSRATWSRRERRAPSTTTTSSLCAPLRSRPCSSRRGS